VAGLTAVVVVNEVAAAVVELLPAQAAEFELQMTWHFRTN
jgi:hypothetical protein